MYYKRHIEETIQQAKEMFKVLLITGPRQVGKTTTLKHLFSQDYHYVTLDDITELSIAKEDPKLFFMNHPLPIIVDEVQFAPSLFHEIKRLVDASDAYGQIILTGSQTFHLMESVTETLAGRVGILEFSGLSLREINRDDFRVPFVPSMAFLDIQRHKYSADIWRVIHRGSMPEIYNNSKIDWQLFYASYVRTYIERDVRSLLNVKNLDLFSKFITSAAARTATVINYSNISKEIGVDIKTIQSWMKVLEASGIVVIIQPFSNNALNRVIESPMLYFMDTGLVSYLLRWTTKDTLQNGAMSGQILETFAVSEIIKSYKNHGINDTPLYFYRDKDMKEIDLIIIQDSQLYPIEIKKSMNPSLGMTKNFKILRKAVGFTIENEIILCLVENKINLATSTVAFPINSI
ncbi:MAG: ATP-binding protein [Acholeplasma sp.]|jgi:predicted AAA+ superfamily ATPase|nr:MAG: ATP-binding protein [Acholeplasma sp.]